MSAFFFTSSYAFYVLVLFIDIKKPLIPIFVGINILVKPFAILLKDVLPESGITELLQDGTYDIPFNIWKRNEETSHEYENYFAPTIQLTRKGSNITILINSLKVDNDYITSVSAL